MATRKMGSTSSRASRPRAADAAGAGAPGKPAKRAGVAKGTIYLYFKDKESMFEELIRTAIVPFVDRMTAPPPVTGSVRDLIEAMARMFIHEVATTRRGDLVRLIVAEGPRFPE